MINSITDEERTWGSLVHIAALVGLLIPFGSLIGPLIVMWIRRSKRTAFVDAQTLEALNFNISVALVFFVCLVLAWFFVGILLIAALVIYWIIMTVTAGIKAGEGHHYRYPIAWRPIK